MQLRRPFDAHLHLRDGPLMQAVLPATAAWCGGAVVMPNLSPPVTSVEAALAYRGRIGSPGFQPHLTCYLTDSTSPAEVVRGHAEGAWIAAKLYPAHATTGSAHGVTDLSGLMPVLEAMAEVGMPLLVHGEVTEPSVDLFDREAVFLDTVLLPLIEALPELKVVLEHATTTQAVQLVLSRPHNLYATITPHHLRWNRNALFQGGLRPHAYCLPVLKRRTHQRALRAAATSGDPRFFLGTDSAPHLVNRKECDHGCAGVFCAPTALLAYAQVFEEEGALDKLEGFASLHGPAMYGLAPSEGRLTLKRQPTTPPEQLHTPQGPLHVFLGGETLRWCLLGDS